MNGSQGRRKAPNGTSAPRVAKVNSSQKPASRAFQRPSLSVGDRVLNNSYVITKVLAEGTGMSNVYQASDVKNGKQWALKQIYDYRIFESTSTPRQQRKNKLEYDALNREAKVMEKLSHPNIPRIVDIIDDVKIHSRFIVMDLVEGKSAMSALESLVTVEPGLAVRWISQLARILMYLHNLKTPMVYRDIKPHNLVITHHSGVNLIDFGTAEFITKKNQRPQNAVGSPGYAPPEQKDKTRPLDVRSDIYSLGVTMAQFLTGVSPIATKENGELYFSDRAPFSIRSVDPNLPRGLEEFVKRCTDPDIERRFDSIEEVVDALTDHNKLDKRYLRKQKSKLHTIYGLGFATLLFVGASGVSYGLHVNQENQLYNTASSVANQTGRTGDYVTAISMAPTRLAPYEGLINSIKRDGTFSTEEEKKLLGLVNPNIRDIKKQDDYGELSYEIGRLYWFYYQAEDTDNDSGKSLSTKWFEDALDNGVEETKLAEVYYSIGMFDRTISSMAQESNDAGEYKKYWDNLIVAQGSENGEVTNLQIYNTIANCIDNYSYRLKTDGVPKEEVEAELLKIQTYLDTHTPSAGTPEELYSQLEDRVDGLQSKIDLAYGDGVE